MKEHAIVVTFLHQLNEVVAVLWCFVIEGDNDVAIGGFYFHLSAIVDVHCFHCF